jgi:FAD/FMN-containing dehydrogenase
VVLAPGELVSLGGPISKEVTGYDLKALIVGSEGTLGVVTDVWLRLMPAPQATSGMVAFHTDHARGCQAVADVLACGVVPGAIDFLDGRALEITRMAYPGDVPNGAGFVVVIEVDGSSDDVAEHAVTVGEAVSVEALAVHDVDVRSMWRWREGVSNAVSSVRHGKVSEDVIVPVNRLDEALGRFHELANARGLDACAWGHGGDGIVHATSIVDHTDPDQLAQAEAFTHEIFALAIDLGGAVSGEHGLGWVKRDELASQWPRAGVAAHDRVKDALDPKGLFNPGKKSSRGFGALGSVVMP